MFKTKTNKKWKVSEVGKKEKRTYMTKKRKVVRREKEYLAILMFLLIGIAVILGHASVDESEIKRNLSQNGILYQVEAKNLSEGQILTNKAILDSGSTMKNEVMALIQESGLNTYDAYMIIQCESHWNPDVVSRINSNGTQDFGLWQINSIHKDISNLHKLDYIKSTKWAIQKRLNDGNWSAWACAKKLGIK
jgi:hypothetical protein